MGRRRPHEHYRTVNGNRILVNDGVQHSGTITVPAGPPPEALNTLTTQTQSFVPATGREPQPTFSERLKRRFKKSSHTAWSKKITSRITINSRTGTGKMTIWETDRSFIPGAAGRRNKKVIQLGPNMQTSADVFVLQHDFRGISFENSVLQIPEFLEFTEKWNIDLRNVNLDGANIKFGFAGPSSLIMSGATLRDTRFVSSGAECKLDMRNADVTGADFKGLRAFKKPESYSSPVSTSLGVELPYIKVGGPILL